MPTRTALEQLAGTVTHDVAQRAGTTRTTKPARPARAPNRLSTLRFGTEVGQKLRGRHAGLELDLVAGHRDSPPSGELRLWAHWLMGRAC